MGGGGSEDEQVCMTGGRGSKVEVEWQEEEGPLGTCGG